jgi:hypothetical protein
MYIVQTCMYMFIQVYARFDSYKHVHIMYKHVHTCPTSVPYFLFTFMYVKVCTADVPCTDGYIHFKKCTDILELCTLAYVSF